VKLVPAVADDLSLSEAERTRGRAFAASLSMRVLSRTWQMLLKGLAEVQQAGRPIAAAEMVLVRIAYAADLPTPDEVIRSLSEGAGEGGAAASAPAARAPSGNGGGAGASLSVGAPRVEAARNAPRAALAASPVARVAESAPAPGALVIGRFEDLVALATERRDLQVKAALERDVRLVRCEDGRLEIALEPGATPALVNDLSRKISAWTGRHWMVALSREVGAPTLRQQAEAREAELKHGVRADPLVQAVLDKFPGAEIVSVTRGRDAEPAAGYSADYSSDMPPDEDAGDDDR
jgi:DNA polymerase-3 subunit gamma/tau